MFSKSNLNFFIFVFLLPTLLLLMLVWYSISETITTQETYFDEVQVKVNKFYLITIEKNDIKTEIIYPRSFSINYNLPIDKKTTYKFDGKELKINLHNKKELKVIN